MVAIWNWGFSTSLQTIESNPKKIKIVKLAWFSTLTIAQALVKLWIAQNVERRRQVIPLLSSVVIYWELNRNHFSPNQQKTHERRGKPGHLPDLSVHHRFRFTLWYQFRLALDQCQSTNELDWVVLCYRKRKRYDPKQNGHGWLLGECPAN